MSTSIEPEPEALPRSGAVVDPPRRLTLLDGMVLVAATAAGFAVVRSSVPGVLEVGTGGLNRSLVNVGLVVAGLAPLVACWNLAWLALRLRQPRPSWRRLARRPGTVACLAAIVGVPLSVALYLPYFVVGKVQEWGLLAAYPVGYAVAAAWAVQALSGRWRKIAGAFDWAGVVLGAYWLAQVPLFVGLLFGLV